jgi:hypothetical protein
MPVKPLKVGKRIYYYNIPVYHFKEIKVKMKTKSAKVEGAGVRGQAGSRMARGLN